MLRRTILAAVVALAATPASALAADQTIQAFDGTAGQGYWSPANVTITTGDTVTWTFTGTSVPHNVAAQSTNWSFETAIGATAPAAYTFTAAGVYDYVCDVHPTTMKGRVTVTTPGGPPPPPPPPPPLSEQPLPNDAGAPSEFEVADALAPRLTRVRTRAHRFGVSVRFRVDEPAMVKVALQRGGRTIKSRRTMARRGAGRLYVRVVRPGRYKLVVTAKDLAGNRSRSRSARVRVG